MIKGKLGKVTIDNTGDVTIADMADWSYSGEVREVISAIPTYDAAFIEEFAGSPKGGDIEVKGLLKVGDTGLGLVEAAFDANTNLTVGLFKLFIDATKYLTPDETISPASYVYVTKKPTAIEHSASGIVQVSFTLHVNGRLKLV